MNTFILCKIEGDPHLHANIWANDVILSENNICKLLFMENILLAILVHNQCLLNVLCCKNMFYFFQYKQFLINRNCAINCPLYRISIYFIHHHIITFFIPLA